MEMIEKIRFTTLKNNYNTFALARVIIIIRIICISYFYNKTQHKDTQKYASVFSPHLYPISQNTKQKETLQKENKLVAYVTLDPSSDEVGWPPKFCIQAIFALKMKKTNLHLLEFSCFEQIKFPLTDQMSARTYLHLFHLWRQSKLICKTQKHGKQNKTHWDSVSR